MHVVVNNGEVETYGVCIQSKLQKKIGSYLHLRSDYYEKEKTKKAEKIKKVFKKSDRLFRKADEIFKDADKLFKEFEHIF